MTRNHFPGNRVEKACAHLGYVLLPLELLSQAFPHRRQFLAEVAPGRGWCGSDAGWQAYHGLCASISHVPCFVWWSKFSSVRMITLADACSRSCVTARSSGNERWFAMNRDAMG